LPVGVIVECRKAVSRWIDHIWLPVAVLEGVPDTPPWSALRSEADSTTYYAGPCDIELFPTETSKYRNNLGSHMPALWVVMRQSSGEPPFEIVLVTANPDEGEALTQSGSDIVEPVPMPVMVREVIAAFVAEHPVEETFFKRQRDRADPEAFGRRERRSKEVRDE
jgi:hypothetical protein